MTSGRTIEGRMITFSATYGSGGAAVAPLVARRLGWTFADRLQPGGNLPPLPTERASEDELADTPTSPFLSGLALLSADWNIPVPTDPNELPGHVRTQLRDGLEELLRQGPSVVLGRAAAATLGRQPGLFHVRLDGPLERRVVRGAIWEGVDAETARRRLEETDSARSRYLHRLYRVDPSDPALYHLVIDGTVMTADACAGLVVVAAEAAWSFDETRLADLARETRQRLESGA